MVAVLHAVACCSPVLSELANTETGLLLCCMQLPVVAQCCQNAQQN